MLYDPRAGGLHTHLHTLVFVYIHVYTCVYIRSYLKETSLFLGTCELPCMEASSSGAPSLHGTVRADLSGCFDPLLGPCTGWVETSAGSAVCSSAGCEAKVLPWACWRGRCSLCARLFLLFQEGKGLDRESAESRIIDDLLNSAVSLARLARASEREEDFLRAAHQVPPPRLP